MNPLHKAYKDYIELLEEKKVLNSPYQKVEAEILRSKIAELEAKQEPIEEEDIFKLATNYATKQGYPQTDKDVFETTYWREHNISTEGFVEGFKAASQFKPKI